MKTLRVSFLAGLVLMLLISVPAQAALQISYNLDSAGWVTLPSFAAGVLPPLTEKVTFTSLISNGITNIFSIDGYALSDVPGESKDAELLGGALSLNNITGASHRLELRIVASGFMLPIAPPTLVWDNEYTVNVTPGHGHAGDQISFTNCADTGALPSCANISTTGVQDISGGGFKIDDDRSLASLAAPYNFSQYMDITLGGGSQIAFQNSEVLSAVPEPVSIALLGGLLLLTSGMIRRRAKGGTTV